MWNRLWTTALVVLAALRLTRFIATDWLGYWAIREPARRWALAGRANWDDLEDPHEHPDKRIRLVTGLDCGYCLSPWIAGGILIGNATVGRLPVVGTVWRWLLATLALSYVVGTLWSRLDA